MPVYKDVTYEIALRPNGPEYWVWTVTFLGGQAMVKQGGRMTKQQAEDDADLRAKGEIDRGTWAGQKLGR